MNAKTVWVHVGLVALFAGGVAAGVLYQRRTTLRAFDDGRRVAEGLLHRLDTATRSRGEDATRRHDPEHFLLYFRERLDLSGEQAAQVKEALDRLHEGTAGLAKDFHDEFTALRARAWADIRAALGEEQRSEFDTLVEEMETDHAPGWPGASDPHEHPGER